MVWLQVWINPGAQRIALRFSFSTVLLAYSVALSSVSLVGEVGKAWHRSLWAYASQFGKPSGKRGQYVQYR